MHKQYWLHVLIKSHMYIFSLFFQKQFTWSGSIARYTCTEKLITAVRADVTDQGPGLMFTTEWEIAINDITLHMKKFI